jgi:hypothetical protein
VTGIASARRPMGTREWMRPFAWPVDNTASERGRRCRCQKGGFSSNKVPGRHYWPPYHVPHASPPPLHSAAPMGRAAFVCPTDHADKAMQDKAKWHIGFQPPRTSACGPQPVPLRPATARCRRCYQQFRQSERGAGPRACFRKLLRSRRSG